MCDLKHVLEAIKTLTFGEDFNSSTLIFLCNFTML